MVTVVASKSVQTVVVNRDRTAEIERVRSEQRVLDARRQSVVAERDTRQVASTSTGLQGPRGETGPMGPIGPAGGAALMLQAGADLGGHRLVRTTATGAAGYVDAGAPMHGDDTVGLTLAAAAAGQDVPVQSSGMVEFLQKMSSDYGYTMEQQ